MYSRIPTASKSLWPAPSIFTRRLDALPLARNKASASATGMIVSAVPWTIRVGPP